MMRYSFHLPRIILLLCTSVLQSQTDTPIFVQGDLRASDKGTAIVESGQPEIKITNPEALHGQQNGKVVLHGIRTKEGILAISFATIDDRNKPYDPSFAAVVAKHKDAEMVAHLLQLGANPNSKTTEGTPALDVAMGMGDHFLVVPSAYPNADIVTLLLNHGANPDALNQDWQTPLMAAAFFGDEGLIRILLEHKANVNIGEKGGKTALIYARDAASLRQLIAAGASANDKDMFGRTALHYAAQRADSESVRVLIEAAANVNARDDKNTSPLHLAVLDLQFHRNFANESLREEHKKQVQSVIDLLLAGGARPDGP
jgi:ankyrin repeat protein